MLLKTLNDRLGPKTITAKGQIEQIGSIVRKKTGEDYLEVKRRKSVKKRKREPILPRRKNIKNIGNTYHSNQHVLRMHEKNTGLLEKTLSRLDPIKIDNIKKDKKESRQVYKPFTVNRYTKKPLTR